MTGRHSRDDGNPRDPLEVERLLSDAFDAQARASVGDDRMPPPPRFETHPGEPIGQPRRRRWLAPAAAAAAVIAVVVGAAGITSALSGDDDHRARAANQPRHSSSSPRPVAPNVSAPGSATAVSEHPNTDATRPTAFVKMSLLNSDGATYGVGMPVVAYFSRKITDASALQSATTVTVNGKPAHGAWYFESSDAGNGPIEGHLRLQKYWPAHSDVTVVVPVQGRSAGAGMSFANNVSLKFRTGPANVSVVDDRTHMMTVRRDGKIIGKYPVSLGANRTPTERGIKVIMEKGRSICMSGPGYHECGVQFTQRLTYGGEYVHAAPWNMHNINNGVDTSNGCTNMTPADAKLLYAMSEVGDVVEYPNASGPTMGMGGGFGDWNVPWSTWQRGGAVTTR